jgi:hypothetical protein
VVVRRAAGPAVAHRRALLLQRSRLSRFRGSHICSRKVHHDVPAGRGSIHRAPIHIKLNERDDSISGPEALGCDCGGELLRALGYHFWELSLAGCEGFATLTAACAFGAVLAIAGPYLFSVLPKEPATRADRKTWALQERSGDIEDRRGCWR